LDNKGDFLDNFFDNSSKKTKKYKKNIPGNIQGDIYIPERPYCLQKGIGKYKMFKGKTFEWFLMHYYNPFINLKEWAEKTLKPEILYREHIIWVLEAFKKLPRPQCIIPGCPNEASHFSIRTSADGEISFGFPYLACEDHIEELKTGDGKISLQLLSPGTINIFQSEQDKKFFLYFLKKCFNFKDLSGQQIFNNLKKYLPTIKIKPHLQIKDKKPKRINSIQYELGL